MDHTLASELRDAGFPQQTLHLGNVVEREKWDPIVGYDPCFVPSLEELVEACGEKVAVFHDGTMWTAGKIGVITSNGLLFFDAVFRRAILAATPKEAVARLYLALNKK